MFRCDQCDNGITEGEPCPYCGAPAQWDEADYSYSDYLDDFRAGFERGPVGSDEFATGVEESIHERSERRADEVTRWDGGER